MSITAETRLPALREELVFLEASADGDGQPGCLIFDPVRHQYFRIGLESAKAFAHWSAGSAGALVERLRASHIAVNLQDIGSLIQFASLNNLVVASAGGLQAQAQRYERSFLSKVLHSYLFFRIPLLRPQKFLAATFPFVRLLGHRLSLLLIGILSLVGVYLTARQFDVFLHSFANFANWQGALLLTVTLVLLKSAHELGHAYVATAKKCRVPVIGIAFMVMVPMLYSDVSDAWRLKNRRDRLAIDFAGMAVEMAIGGVALFFWALMADGPLRDLLLFVATTSWVMSLLVNLSPFMRFDGYHILADSLGIHNLQARGFALGKWQMREWLFGLGDRLPERFRPGLHRLLIAYAWGTWTYRFFLFLGIALLVYYMFFKLLGIFLLAVELLWFIVMPIFREVRFWWQRRGDILASRRGLISLGLGGGVALLLVLPISSHVSVPGVLGAQVQAQVYAPGPAQVSFVGVGVGDRVKKGDILAKLLSPQIEEATRRAQLRLRLVRLRLARGVSDEQERALRQVLEKEQDSLVGELAGLKERRARLVLRAPISGQVRAMLRGLQPGLWVNDATRLFHIVSLAPQLQLHGLLDEADLGRVRVGDAGVFIAENPQARRQAVRVAQIGLGTGMQKNLSYLASVNGGTVSTQRLPDGRIRTERAVFSALFSVEPGAQPAAADEWAFEQRGRVTVNGKRQSLAGRFFNHAFAVLLREAGF